MQKKAKEKKKRKRRFPPIPPQWTNVTRVKQTNERGRNVTIKITGYDAKGRLQSIYPVKVTQANSENKFARVRKLLKEYKRISKIIRKDMEAGYEAGRVAWLILTTGMRPGSNSDTKADKKAYGACTLLCKHITVLASGNVRLKFTGKKGVSLNVPVQDETLAEMFRQRKRAREPGRAVFKLSSTSLGNYLKSFCSYTAKDFRTAKGILIAEGLLAKRKRIPKTKTERKRIVNSIIDQVAKVLGNTRAVARKSYIDPAVWAGWLDD